MTNEEKRKIYAALSAPFPEEAIQRTDGRITGKGYSTTGIGYAFITARLNEVVGLGNWRTHREITVKSSTTPKGRQAYEAICDLAMELGEWNADGKFIAWADTVSDGGHVSFSEADARKGSFTNALKKAAAMFGCGRQAYEGTLDDDNHGTEDGGEDIVRIPSAVSPARPQQPVRVAPEPARAPQLVQPQATQQPAVLQDTPLPLRSQPAPARNRLTTKQLAALWALARKTGSDQSQFRTQVKQREGVQPEFLSREAASKLIGEMSASLGNGHAAEFGHEG
jgi:hypothetical protein